MRVTIVIIAMFALGCIKLSAQAPMKQHMGEAFKYKPKLEFKLDSRNSFITNQPIRVFGIKLGLNYFDRISLGIGLSGLNTDIKQRLLVDINGEQRPVEATLNFGYFSIYGEYTFYESKKWEISIPLQIGLGSSSFNYSTPTENIVRAHNNPILLYEPAMAAQYKIFKWFGISAGVGYRLMLVNNPDIVERFTSPVYVLKLKVELGTLGRLIINKEKKFKKKK